MALPTIKLEDFPNFNEGDEVTFEAVPYAGGAAPRWDVDNTDRGSSYPKLWAKGFIVEISADFIYIEYAVEGFIGIGEYSCPNWANKNYTSWQWKRDGYLRKIITPKCVCGSDKIYGKTSSLHSFWCDKKQGDKSK